MSERLHLTPELYFEIYKPHKFHPSKDREICVFCRHSRLYHVEHVEPRLKESKGAFVEAVERIADEREEFFKQMRKARGV